MPPPDPLHFCADALFDLAGRGLRRTLRTWIPTEGMRGTLDGRPAINFGSNDYLGLGRDPRLAAAARAAAEEAGGWGPAASRLLAGTTPWHNGLESDIARFKGTEGALFFPSGYMANLGTLTALSEAGSLICADALNHASLVDACRLSRAEVFVYPHRDMAALNARLADAQRRGTRRMIVTDSVFSMDGDLAPLPELVEIARRHDAALVVDDAHATGVFGRKGRGAAEHLGVADEIPVTLGTFSKAAASVGGFSAASATVVEFLIHRARPFIFTTAPPPALCAANRRALELFDGEPERRDRLWANQRGVVDELRGMGCRLTGTETPILPVLIGDEAAAVAVAEALLAAGCYVPAIRHPTVPRGSARLRISLSAAHTEEDLRTLFRAMQEFRGRGGSE
ncbi:MAG: 8-amino-7-oxononanoate synthase [Planctomycetes bacterium]|nr:8-amino-7-oxononanoate synthase [Planctomycetota bacterium]